MIRLIAGLGNPGNKYHGTRHNAGFLFADRIAELSQVQWQEKKSFKGLVAALPGNECWLIKPTTFMNLSGDAVAALTRYYKISVDEILIAHDELDLPAGTIRLKSGGGHGGHNGLRDLIGKIGSPGFHRLRIGIGHPGSGDQVLNYVLGKPAVDDLISINRAIDQAAGHLDQILAGEFQPVMNDLHSKPSDT
ncbi:MAG: aminoacyl-tRNA hydrolase [Gammaproteobacteria bacterium]|nr:MAG: aminoacyl-tRNA hydrolase [Gammaproteobacteria bacterium]